MWLNIILYLVLAPVVGGLLAGVDRRLSARMQGRVGPPLRQPFFDFFKLLEKESLVVRRSQNFYVFFSCLMTVFAGALFFAGGDLLLVIFALALGGIFFVLAGYKASSPYSVVGAQRELLQMMSYEPALILAAVGMYMVTGSFIVRDIALSQRHLYLLLPGLLASFLFIMLIKFRKSPFDLSTSHHGHQELVKGITTEFSGRALAVIELMHWYENVFVLGMVYLFFARTPVLGVAMSLGAFLFTVLVDNVCARVKWQAMLASAWLVTLVLGFGNIMAVFFWGRGN